MVYTAQRRRQAQIDFLLGKRTLQPIRVKILVTETYGRHCSICNLVEWRGKPAPLVMDHLDGNPENNKLYNLRLVCGNCDMQLATYKSKNKGNGRAWRRKRYQDGLSY